MTVSDIGRTHVIRTEPTTPLVEVAELLALNDVGSVVVASTGTPVGIVTDRDVALAVADTDGTLDTVTAGDVMSDEIHTVDPAATLVQVTALMAEHSVRRVPIVEDQELVGIVTLDDVLLALSAELDDVAAVVEAESP